MKFEYLPNELLLDSFQFLHIADLLRAFSDLNARFESLLLTKIRSYCLDFRQISKQNFDIFCQKYFPLIIDRVISLHLSNDDQTPYLHRVLFSYGFTIDRFSHLRSLSLYCIIRPDILNQILYDARHLPYLTHFKLQDANMSYDLAWDKFACVMDNIWSLPRLISCIIDCSFWCITFERKELIRAISEISPSLKYLSKSLVFLAPWGALRHASNVAFLCLQAANIGINSQEYLNFASQQINYILGDSGRSYVIGFGQNYPQRSHHTSSSCPNRPAVCDWNAYSSPHPNPQLLIGALVGGPDQNDNYEDRRDDYVKNEVTTDYNAGFQSAVAGLLHQRLKS